MLKSFADGAIFGEQWGTDPPRVLALHGWGRDRSDFREVLGGLDALAVDLPGFGSSPEPPTALGARGYADLMSPIFDEANEEVVILGHSFGGRVALHMAVTQPERVAALVLVGVPLLRRAGAASRPPIAYRAVRTLHRVGLIGSERMEQARRRYGSPDYRNASGVMRDVLVRVVNESYEAELAKIRLPVHLVWGANDQDVPVEVAERAAQILAQCRLSVIQDVGHHACREAPEAVRSVVLKALS